MKKIENLLLQAAGYTVIILFLFFIFAATGDFTKAAITFPQFATILCFGVTISVAGLIFKLDSIKKWIRILIHYAVLLAAFTVIFIITGNLVSGGTGTVFSAVVIFTFFYAIIAALVYFVGRFIKSADKKVDIKARRNTKPAAKKEEYTPRFGKGSN